MVVLAAQQAAESDTAFMNVTVILLSIGLMIAALWYRKLSQKGPPKDYASVRWSVSAAAVMFAAIFVWDGVESTAPFSSLFYWVAGGLAVGASMVTTILAMRKRL